jgi:rhodanese-related sulfurtransferase
MRSMQNLGSFYKLKVGIPSLLNLFGERPDRITADGLMRLMEAGERLTILDVRSTVEHINGRISGSILVSSQNLQYMEKHSFEERVILYCTAGVRSYRESKRLAARGIRVVDLVGGIDAWEDAGGKIECG